MASGGVVKPGTRSTEAFQRLPNAGSGQSKSRHKINHLSLLQSLSIIQIRPYFSIPLRNCMHSLHVSFPLSSAASTRQLCCAIFRCRPLTHPSIKSIGVIQTTPQNHKYHNSRRPLPPPFYHYTLPRNWQLGMDSQQLSHPQKMDDL